VKYLKEIRIATLFIVAIALFIWGFNFMKGKNIFSSERVFYSVYERTAGLTLNNAVMVNGHQVGLVRSINFLEGDPEAKLIVKLGITSDIPIPADSRAIIETSLLGANVISIQLGKSATMAQDYDTLAAVVATSLQEQFSLEMLPIKKKAENVMLSLDSLLVGIRYVFNEETRHDLTTAMQNIRHSVDMLKRTTYNIDTLVNTQKNRLSRIFANVESITANFENNNEALSLIIQNFASVSDTIAKIQFAQTIRKADAAIADFASVIHKVNEGDGSLALLVNDKKLYSELEKSSSELKALITDIKLNPERYVNVSVFGRTKKKEKYSPPAEE
jgi:phospholipid/cholesterol/gamma-HCH transport system substrate-binding protein